jgi:hypothetical protein
MGAEVGKVDQRQQKCRDPEQMYVREERQQAQDRDNFELQFLRLMGHSLRQRMEPKVEIADPKNNEGKEDAVTIIKTSVSPGLAM